MEWQPSVHDREKESVTLPEPPPGWQQQPAQPPASGMPYLAQPPHQYYPPHPYPYPPARSTNGMAVASMVLGIVWVYWIGSILALVFGYLALRDIRRSGQKGEGMAVAGIVLGWVGVAVLVLVLYLVSKALI